MSERRRFLGWENLALLFWSLVLGLAAAAAFGAYRAVTASGEVTAGRLAAFAVNLLWPGVLIFAAVAAVVWLGWKANLD
ncbi:MAG: hypothetical protein A2148_08145 [Chloroflexi bacterium RBG_16_68_14]|nr:MAG: hypothetical protein A2148_08145 [Chloroflexi bacterium RBG_16_68_14]